MNVVLVGAPRSGAGLLASLLCLDEGWSSSRLSSASVADLDAAAAEPGGLSRLATPTRAAGAVTVDWSPRLAVRLSSVADALADSRFILMVRRPVPTISSLVDAWRSGRFVSEPDLPGWWGEKWSFPLIAEWQELVGAPPARVCAMQWASLTSTLLDALAALPDQRWTVASYEGLLVDPAGEIDDVVGRLGLPWSGVLPDPLPVTPSAVTRPDSAKWTRNWPEISAALPAVQDVADRLHSIAEARRPGLPWPELERRAAPAGDVRTQTSDGTPFQSSHTGSMASLLAQAGRSLLVTTYKSGHAIIARHDEGVLNTEFTNVSRAMGVAVAGNRLAIGGADVILSFTNNPGLSGRAPSPKPPDAVYAPRAIVFTGDVAIHDMAYGADGALYFVNTRFSCLCRQDIDYSFVPIWRPAWITALAAEDRCHLNGLAMVDGVPRYVTALSQTDTPAGWRELKGTSGVIIDVTDGRIVTSGLAMPHSPCWHDGRLWVLESGKGTLSTVDVATGEVRLVATLPGFTRGLDFIGPYALVGLSQVRESVFSGLPITQEAAERNCGVWLVDTRNGTIAGFLRFGGVVQEIFDVKVLPAKWPTILDAGEITHSAFVLPEDALGDVARPG